MSERLDAAIDYSTKGWRVIPIGRGLKVPTIKDWPSKATTDKGQIYEWWSRVDPPNVGIVTGKESGLFVLDVDVANGKSGDETLSDLEATYGPLPETYEVITGSGGRHLYFTYPEGKTITNNANRLGSFLDVRGEGGFVVAPPSDHASGGSYAQEASSPLDVAEAPGWLIALLTTIADGEEKRRERSPRTPGTMLPGDRYAAAVTWPEILEADGAVFVDSRTDHVHGNKYELWARPPFPGEVGYEAHTSASLYYGDKDVLKVFTDNWRGEGWALEQEATYSKLGYYAARNHAGDHSAAASALAREYPDTAAAASVPLDEADEGQPESLLDRLLDRQLIGDELSEVTPPEPLIGNGQLLVKDSIAILYGAPGSGKSLVALDMVLSIARGIRWHGLETHGGKAIYLMAEGAHGMSLRANAWKQQLMHATLDGVIWYPDPLPLTERAVAPVVAQWAGMHSPDLVVIDTLNRSLGGMDENSSEGMGAFVDACDQIRVATGACVLIVHHPGKDDSKGARGHSSLKGAANTEIRVSKTDATVAIKVTKQKDGPDTFATQLRMTPLAESVVVTDVLAGTEKLDSDPTSNDLMALNALCEAMVPEGLSATEWRRTATEVPESSFYVSRARLIEWRVAEKVGNRYFPGSRLMTAHPTYWARYQSTLTAARATLDEGRDE